MVCHHSTHVLFWVYQSVSPIDTTICWDWHSPTWLDLHFDEELPSNCVVLEISCSQNWFECSRESYKKTLYLGAAILLSWIPLDFCLRVQ
jgi:hypothetical protein